MPWESPESVAQTILNRLKRKDFKSEFEFTNYLVSRIRQIQTEIREACVQVALSYESEALVRDLREKVRVEGDEIGGNRQVPNLQSSEPR
jgi:hypothetical protein